jgi:pimeloyl-ACP methyl ester carboxylesterase
MHHPSLVAKVVSTGGNYSTDGIDPQALEFVKAAKASEWPAEVRESYAKTSPDGAAHWPVVFERIRKMWLSEPNWTTKDLATIKAPTLVIAGDHDMVRTSHTVALAGAIPNAQLAILPGAGHEVVIENPAQWNAVVLAFLTAPPAKSEK